MDDLRLVAARRLTWDKDAWRRPAHLAFVIRALNDIITSEAESPEARTEAEMLIKRLRLAWKRPALA